MNNTTTGSGTDERVVPGGRRPTPGERERVLSEWATSGRSVVEMAASTGWSLHTLYRWRRDAGQAVRRRAVVTESSSTPPLLPVPKPAERAATGWTAEVVTGMGVSVRLSADCPAGWAAALVRELSAC